MCVLLQACHSKQRQFKSLAIHTLRGFVKHTIHSRDCYVHHTFKGLLCTPYIQGIVTYTIHSRDCYAHHTFKGLLRTPYIQGIVTYTDIQGIVTPYIQGIVTYTSNPSGRPMKGDNFHVSKNVNRFGLPLRRGGSKQKDLGSIPLWLSSLFNSCSLWTLCYCDLSLTINGTFE